MRRLVVILTVLILLLPILLTACGENGEETPTAISTATITDTTTVTTTPAPNMEPVKIGVIFTWSGPMSVAGILVDQVISLVEDQVKNAGGILGGREVKFYRGDDSGLISQSVAQAKKLALDNKVSILTLGGISAAHFAAVASAAEELKVPFVALSIITHVATYNYSACTSGPEWAIGRTANFIIDYVKPKTVAYLGWDSSDCRDTMNGVEGVIGVRDRLKAAGIDIVYEDYFPQDTMDLSPYITKIKYLKPDLLVTGLNSAGQALMIFKEIAEQGGWGNIKYYNSTEASSSQSVVKMPAALGTYTAVAWLPGSDEPGMKAFEDAFKQKYNRLPDPNQAYFYNTMWIAIKAIELAGTDDHDKVAQALRSGSLEWDSALGPLRIGSDGIGYAASMVAHVQAGGKLVNVWTWYPE